MKWRLECPQEPSVWQFFFESDQINTLRESDSNQDKSPSAHCAALKLKVRQLSFFRRKQAGFIIIKAKQDFKSVKICLIKHKVSFTLVYTCSKCISGHKDTAFGV
jgi:hypothetical protein